MLELYNILSGIISPICTCYNNHYPTLQDDESKVYPFATINFPNVLLNNEFSDNNLLQIDIWDNKDTDINEIETITDAIHKALNYYNYIDENMQFSIYRDTVYRLDLPDPEITMQRRQLKYVLKIYEI